MEVPFELSSVAVDGIKLLNSVISEELSKKIIVNAVKQLLITGPALPARADIYKSEICSDAIKADFGICSLLVTSAQHDFDAIKFKILLDHHKINAKTNSQLVESFDKFREEIKSRLEKYGNSHNIPTLTDIDYEIQHKTIPAGEVVFKLILKGFDHVKNEKVIIEEFYCNNEELQLLISKIKDIERHCERFSKT